MIYDSLANYYDLLVKDESATQHWVDFTERYLPPCKILELACGSGEITLALATAGYQVFATDLSEAMLEEAKLKDVENKIGFQAMDMSDFHLNQTFEGVICYCDSLNYLQSQEEVKSMFECVYEHLNERGIFLFDMHSLDRKEEFAEEYIEEGELEDVQYQWTIQSDEDEIVHHFTFWLPHGQILQEMHIQKIYPPHWILNTLEKIGFETSILTDFDQEGIHSGEKYFIVAQKKEGK